jgi:sugar phosphate isomerase/epimerase
MYRNFSPHSLGVSGRQSELIELALTYGFQGLDINFGDLARRAEHRGFEDAAKFILSAKKSANIKVGGFELPIRWQQTEAIFKGDLNRLQTMAPVAKQLDASCCFLNVEPASSELAYHENFEQHKSRLTEIGDVLAPHDITLGLNFSAAAADRQDKEYQFIHAVEPLLSLVNGVNHPNVGILLDQWHWTVGGGTLDQLSSLPVSKVAIVRLAEPPEGFDPETVEAQQRLFPGENGDDAALQILRILLDKGYSGPVSIFSHASRFLGMTRESIVQRAADTLLELWIALGLAKPPVIAPVEADEDADDDSDDDSLDGEDDEVTTASDNGVSA